MNRSQVRLLPFWLVLFNLAVLVVVVLAFAFYFGPRLTAAVRITEGALLRSAAEAIHPVRDFLYRSPTEAEPIPMIRFGYYVHEQDEDETPEGLGARYVCALSLAGFPVDGRIIMTAYAPGGDLLMTADFRLPHSEDLGCVDFNQFIDYANPEWRVH